MQAGHEGAGREKSFGVNIRLPFEQTANPVIQDDPKLINFKYFFTRKLAFVKETSAIVLFPGGFGTHDEGFEALTLMQTGKGYVMPLIYLDPPGDRYWDEWEAYVDRQLVKRGMVSPEDKYLFTVTEDVELAVREIQAFYSVYHSLRYVRDVLVLRIQRPLPRELLAKLNEEFSDILVAGRIDQRGPFPEEANEPGIAHLTRLALRFDRHHFGKLRALIDRINGWDREKGIVVDGS
jgi:predicted Rossmann-fold nucleotide-binding protein